MAWWVCQPAAPTFSRWPCLASEPQEWQRAGAISPYTIQKALKHNSEKGFQGIYLYIYKAEKKIILNSKLFNHFSWNDELSQAILPTPTI